MRKSRAIALSAALLVLLAAGWWFGSPWWTLWRMREAAQAGDSDALAAYIDFPALRVSVREQLRPNLGPAADLLVGPAVDALVSPDSLRLVLLRRREGGGPGEFEMVRTGPGEFRLARGKGEFVFRRHGLGWKLEEIRLRSAP